MSELYDEEVLDKVLDRNDIAQCLRKIMNNKTEGSDGEGKVLLLEKVFSIIRHAELVPR